MNKTVYVREEDVPVWERARELAGDKLSPAIVAGLRKFIADKEAEGAAAKGFERIELSFRDAEDHGIRKIKAFQGRWIIPPEKPLDASGESDTRHNFAVAVTVKGAAVFYSWWVDREGESPRTFEVFPSLEQAAANNSTNYAALKAIDEVGVPVEELDI